MKFSVGQDAPPFPDSPPAFQWIPTRALEEELAIRIEAMDRPEQPRVHCLVAKLRGELAEARNLTAQLSRLLDGHA